MEVTLTKQETEIIENLRKSGHYANAYAVIRAALRALERRHASEQRPLKLSPEEWVRQFDEFMAEVDRDPPSEAGPLSDAALSRETFYDTERTRV